MATSIIGTGAAAPSLRLAARDVAEAWGNPGDRGQIAVCAADEDALTLGWHAALAAMQAAEVEPSDVGGLWWGTQAPPFAEGPNLAYLAATLHLPATLHGALTTGSAHAGVDALVAAWDAIEAGTVQVALVVASDAVRPGKGTSLETNAGAGAAAFVLRAGDGPAVLRRRVTRQRPVLDRYRGATDTSSRDAYDGRLFREQVFLPEVRTVGADLAADPIAAWVLPDPDGRLAKRAAKELGIGEPASAPVFAELGDPGAAGTPLGIAACLGDTGTVAAIAYGGGRTSGLTVDVSAPVPGADAVQDQLSRGRPATYAQALRARGQLVAETEPIAMGVPPGGAGFVRGGEELLGLTGAKCTACGTISTPPSVHPTCVGCGGDDLTEVPLSRRGTVQTFVVNQTMPPPFEGPLPMVVVDLEDGARLLVQGAGDGSDLEVGAPVELVLTRYTIERGAPIYGFKARATSTPPSPASGVPTRSVGAPDRHTRRDVDGS